MDAVADRSFILEPLSALVILFLDLSRFAEDFIIFSGPEFGFLALDDAITTSSSLMPQKKNPDVFELLRTAPARIFGDFGRLALTLKGLPSTYDKDLQDDKVPLFRGVEEAIRLLRVFLVTLGKIEPRPKALAKTLDPFLFATDLVDYLTARGVPFRGAHGLVGEIVRFAETKGRALNALTLSELRGFHAAFAADVFEVFDPGRSVRQKRTGGSTHPAEVRRQIRKAKRIVGRPA
jgi:argininosuccinate lyase